MDAPNKKWIVRDGKGHIYGPFDQGKLQELLRKGVLTGEEETAHYPAGDWGPMSADRDLYDLVLSALAGPRGVEGYGAPKTPEVPKKSDEPQQVPDTSKVSASSVKMVSISKKEEYRENISFRPEDKGPSVEMEGSTKPLGKPLDKKSPKTSSSSSSKAGSMPPPPETPQPPRQKNTAGPGGPPPLTKPRDIELADKTALVRRKKLSANFVPFLLLLAAGLLFYYGFNYRSGGSKRQAINLIMPHPKGRPDSSKAEALLKRGWSFFYKDTYSNYIRAEETFVEAVESNPQNPETILMLLMTDLQLWSFAKQDSSDQNIVQTLVQMISQVDRQGRQRAIAASAVDIMLGHDTSARTQIDSSLVENPAEGRLYEMKGQLFFDSGSYQEAPGYFEKAASLLSYWVQPIYMLGLNASHQGNAADAQKYLVQALKMNPSHAAARLELGIVEERFFSHDDKAREYLTVSLDGTEKLPPLIEARGRYWLALLMEKSGNKAGAKAQAQIALSLNPSDPDVRDFLAHLGVNVSTKDTASDREHLTAGDQYMRMGNYLGAQAQFKAAFAANPKNARAAMKTAEALWKLHQSDEAIDYLQKSMVADPKFIESYVMMADYKSQRYDFAGALKSLESAVKVNPKSYEVYRGFGEVMYRRGDAQGAESFVSRALALYEIDVKSNILMSKVQLGKKELEKAAQFGKRAVELDKGDSEAQVNYAKVLAAYEGVRGGTDYLTELINTYPTQLPYRIGMAEIMIQDEQYSQAKTVLAQVLAADDKNKEAYLLMGDSSLLANDLQAAVGSYIDAARIDPSDPTALFRLGEVYLKAGKSTEAANEFESVIHANPLFPRAHYNLARAYYQAQLIEKSVEELEQEKKLNPKLADPYEFEGDLYLATRKYVLAAREYQKVAEIRNQGAQIYVKMAKAYRGQGSFDEAMAMLRLAAARESGYAELYREYGYLYDARGMASEAVTSFQQYLRLEPNSPDKQAILDKINQLE